MSRQKKRLDGRYSKQVFLGLSEDGKRRYKTFYGTTQKEASEKAAEYKAAIGNGLDPDQSGSTFLELAKQYQARKKAEGVGASWARSLQNHIDHMEPFHQYQVDKIRAANVQKVLNNLAEWHDGKPPLSHKTLSQILSTARAIFDSAIPEIVLYNPCSKVSVPAGKAPVTRDALNNDQQAWVRDTPHRAQRAAMLMMYSGLRRGEATMLTWGDIDLGAGTIRVNKSIDYADGGKSKGTKTKAGMRTVDIPKVLATYLQEEKEAEDPLGLYVVHSANGDRMTEQAWRTLWSSYMTDLNAKYGHNGANKHACCENDEKGHKRGRLPMVIKTFTPHQLRHTFCTMMYLAGVDVLTASKQMGHSNPQITMSIYTHLDEVYKRKSMNKLDSFLELCMSNACQAT